MIGGEAVGEGEGAEEEDEGEKRTRQEQDVSSAVQPQIFAIISGHRWIVCADWMKCVLTREVRLVG